MVGAKTLWSTKTRARVSTRGLGKLMRLDRKLNHVVAAGPNTPVLTRISFSFLVYAASEKR